MNVIPIFFFFCLNAISRRTRPYVTDKHTMCLPFVTVLRMLCVRVACVCLYFFFVFILLSSFLFALALFLLSSLCFFFFSFSILLNVLALFSFYVRPSIVFVSSCVNMLEPRKRSSLRRREINTHIRSHIVVERLRAEEGERKRDRMSE